MAFTVTSPAFADGQPVPAQFTCDGNDAPPPLKVSDPPKDTRSFAVIMEDPDAPKGTFTHWLAKAHHADKFIDVIFSSGNGIADVACDSTSLLFGNVTGLAVTKCANTEQSKKNN